MQLASESSILTSAEGSSERSAIERNIEALLPRLADIERRKQKLMLVYIDRDDISPELFAGQMDALDKESETVRSAIERQRIDLTRSVSLEQEMARLVRLQGISGEMINLLDTNPAALQRFLLTTIRITVVPLSDGKTIIDNIAIV